MNAWQRLRQAAARGLGLIALGVMLAACGSGGGGDTDPLPPPVPAMGSVSGRVLSSATGAALAGVKVTAGTRTATTAADGKYTLSEVPVGDPAPIRFELAGHAPGHASVRLLAGGSATANPRLVPVGATQNFDAAAAATLVVAGTVARVELPAAGLVNARTGAAATGTLTAEVTVIDPATDPASMPGNYTASSSSGTQTIESFGAINVNLRDAAGNALNLAAGQRATIRIPVSTRSASVPATMPLFYFNETTGLWVQEGTATLAGTAPNQYYEGTVSHFSYWNADQVADTIRVLGCVVDAAGAPVADVDVSTVGLDYSGTGHGSTDAQGRFSVPMRKGGVASLFGELGNRATNIRQVGPSQVDIQLTPCLVLGTTAQAPAILVQPQSQTAQPGGFVVFEVRAVGSGVLRYQWTRNGVALDGAVFSRHYVLPVTDGDNGAVYRVIVTGEAGSITSDPATLTVQAVALPPLILTQPQATEVLVGATATFSVEAESQGGTLGYQWRRNGVDLAGATAASYTTPPVVAGDNGAIYTVRVSSSNSTSVLSSGARLGVTAMAVGPTITTQPRDANVGVGQAASFSVTASGTPTLRYQWKRNGVDITGATASTYTTAATVQGDNGAVFSVRVSNDVGGVNSDNATLSVTAPVGQGGYYLVSPAGPMVEGTVQYANGSQGISSAALVAVSVASPTLTPVTLVPAGQGIGFGLPVFEATVSGGQLSNLRSRYTVFVQGNRFYKVDQVAEGNSVPTPQLLSDLTTNSVCGSNGSPLQDFEAEGFDLADPLRSWLFVRTPGADSVCGTADDTVRAARIGMSGSTAPVNLGTAQPVAAIHGSNGALSGLLVRNGTQLQQLNADLGGASNLFTVGASFSNGPVVVAGSMPGVWFHVDGGKVYAVNLAAPGTRQEVATLQAGETLGLDIIGSNGEFFVPLEASAGARVLRVTAALSSSVVATFGQRLLDLHATDTHLVATVAGGAPQTVLRSGGTPTALLALAVGESVTTLWTGATGVAVGVNRIDLSNGTFSTRTVLVNGDGSNAQTLANTALLGGVTGSTVPLADTLQKTYAVFLADNVTALGSQAGATVRALALDTRAPLVTYGTLPATPAGQLFPFLAGPYQYTQPGLFAFVGTSTSNVAIDLYYFDSDAAGLTRVTSFVSDTGRAVLGQNAGHVSAAAARLRPRRPAGPFAL